MMHAKQRGGRINVSTILVVCGGLLLMLLLAVFLLGRVGGQEFSPQRFTTRSFSYYQIPLLRIQIWPVRIYKTTNDLAKYLRANKLLGGAASKPVRWDIVTMYEGGRQLYRGDASILTNYLQQPSAVGTESWLSWSKNHPKLEKELWPVVARMAHEDMYVIVPALLEAARGIESKDDFAEKLRRIVVSELIQFANAEKQSGDTERANELLDIAMEYDPDDGALRKAKD